MAASDDPNRPARACAICKRAIYVDHADDQGRCVNCRPADKPAKDEKPKGGANL